MSEFRNLFQDTGFPVKNVSYFSVFFIAGFMFTSIVYSDGRVSKLKPRQQEILNLNEIVGAPHCCCIQ